MRVFTVGHSTHPLEAFAALLRGHGVTAVADVRRVPRSGRHPQFAAEALAAGLPEHGLAYGHLAALGGWRRPLRESPNGGWRNASFRAYADYALTAEFAAGLAQLRALARERPTAIMCSEGLWWRCHRRLISDAVLLLHRREVGHLGHDGRVVPHRPSAGARVSEGVLRYDADAIDS